MNRISQNLSSFFSSFRGQDSQSKAPSEIPAQKTPDDFDLSENVSTTDFIQNLTQKFFSQHDTNLKVARSKVPADVKKYLRQNFTRKEQENLYQIFAISGFFPQSTETIPVDKLQAMLFSLSLREDCLQKLEIYIDSYNLKGEISFPDLADCVIYVLPNEQQRKIYFSSEALKNIKNWEEQFDYKYEHSDMQSYKALSKNDLNHINTAAEKKDLNFLNFFKQKFSLTRLGIEDLSLFSHLVLEYNSTQELEEQILKPLSQFSVSLAEQRLLLKLFCIMGFHLQKNDTWDEISLTKIASSLQNDRVFLSNLSNLIEDLSLKGKLSLYDVAQFARMNPYPIRHTMGYWADQDADCLDFFRALLKNFNYKFQVDDLEKILSVDEALWNAVLDLSHLQTKDFFIQNIQRYLPVSEITFSDILLYGELYAEYQSSKVMQEELFSKFKNDEDISFYLKLKRVFRLFLEKEHFPFDYSSQNDFFESSYFKSYTILWRHPADFINFLREKGVDVIFEDYLKQYSPELLKVYSSSYSPMGLLSDMVYFNRSTIQDMRRESQFAYELGHIFPNYEYNYRETAYFSRIQSKTEFLKVTKALIKKYPELQDQFAFNTFNAILILKTLSEDQEFSKLVLSDEYEKVLQEIKRYDKSFVFDFDQIYQVAKLVKDNMNPQSLYEGDFPAWLEDCFPSLVDEKVNELLKRYKASKARFDFERRVYFYQIYSNPQFHPIVTSPDFKKNIERFSKMILGNSPYHLHFLEALIFVEQNPALWEMLQTYPYRIKYPSDVYALYYAIDHPQLYDYQAVLQKLIPSYIPRANDLEAIYKLSQKYSLQDFEVLCRKRLKWINIKLYTNMNDLYYLLSSESAKMDHAILEKVISQKFSQDIHRQDLSYFGYRTYNNLEQFSFIELVKMYDLIESLDKDKNLQKHILKGIEDDKKQKFSEKGGIVEFESGQMNFTYLEPRQMGFDGSYEFSEKYFGAEVGSLAKFHQHALTANDSEFAGPSSGMIFFSDADLGNAYETNVDGIVISSYQDDKFIVHFYNTLGDVAFLGIYG